MEVRIADEVMSGEGGFMTDVQALVGGAAATWAKVPPMCRTDAGEVMTDADEVMADVKSHKIHGRNRYVFVFF